MSSKILLHRTIIIISLLSFLLSACATIPEASKEEKELQGTLFDSYKSIMVMIQSEKLNPYQIEVTSGKEKKVREYFGELSMLADKLSFSEEDLGTENEGYLREENPEIIFPVVDDRIESDSFQTYINVWQFNGVENKKVDIILRSFSTFPTGIFFPYFILVDNYGKPLARQTEIIAIDKEMIKSQSVMTWTEDFALPYSGKYYVFVICDVSNIGKDTHLIRLGDQRVPVSKLYENISTSTVKPLLPYQPSAKIGKYELIVRIFE